MNDILTIREVASYLRLSLAQTYVLCHQKKLPHIRMGKRIVVRREALEKWLQAQTVTVYDIQGKPFA